MVIFLIFQSLIFIIKLGFLDLSRVEVSKWRLVCTGIFVFLNFRGKMSPSDGGLRRRVCIIGAGVSGLPAIKSCLENDLDVVCYERTSEIGGLWNYRPGKEVHFKRCFVIHHMHRPLDWRDGYEVDGGEHVKGDYGLLWFSAAARVAQLYAPLAGPALLGDVRRAFWPSSVYPFQHWSFGGLEFAAKLKPILSFNNFLFFDSNYYMWNCQTHSTSF